MYLNVREELNDGEKQKEQTRNGTLWHQCDSNIFNNDINIL